MVEMDAMDQDGISTHGSSASTSPWELRENSPKLNRSKSSNRSTPNDKRREQNRLAQRKFRARQENELAGLKEQVETLQVRCTSAESRILEQAKVLDDLRAENEELRRHPSAPISINIPSCSSGIPSSYYQSMPISPSAPPLSPLLPSASTQSTNHDWVAPSSYTSDDSISLRSPPRRHVPVEIHPHTAYHAPHSDSYYSTTSMQMDYGSRFQQSTTDYDTHVLYMPQPRSIAVYARNSFLRRTNSSSFTSNEPMDGVDPPTRDFGRY